MTAPAATPLLDHAAAQRFCAGVEIAWRKPCVNPMHSCGRMTDISHAKPFADPCACQPGNYRDTGAVEGQMGQPNLLEKGAPPLGWPPRKADGLGGTALFLHFKQGNDPRWQERGMGPVSFLGKSYLAPVEVNVWPSHGRLTEAAAGRHCEIEADLHPPRLRFKGGPDLLLFRQRDFRFQFGWGSRKPKATAGVNQYPASAHCLTQYQSQQFDLKECSISARRVGADLLALSAPTDVFQTVLPAYFGRNIDLLFTQEKPDGDPGVIEPFQCFLACFVPDLKVWSHPLIPGHFGDGPSLSPLRSGKLTGQQLGFPGFSGRSDTVLSTPTSPFCALPGLNVPELTAFPLDQRRHNLPAYTGLSRKCRTRRMRHGSDWQRFLLNWQSHILLWGSTLWISRNRRFDPAPSHHSLFQRLSHSLALTWHTGQKGPATVPKTRQIRIICPLRLLPQLIAGTILTVSADFLASVSVQLQPSVTACRIFKTYQHATFTRRSVYSFFGIK